MSAPELPTDVQGGSLDPLVRALRDAGYSVAEGSADVRNLIHAASGDDVQPLCSGWRVFPGGKKCQGCADCSPNDKLTDSRRE